MIDSDLISLADRKITQAFEEQNDKLSLELGKIRAEAAQRGVIRSSHYILNVQKACEHTTIERGRLVWDILFRCITTVGISYDESIEQQLKTAVDKHFPEHMNGLKYHVVEAARISGMSDIISKLPDGIGGARSSALRKIHNEIDLFLMSLKNKRVETPYAPPQINIHNSNIGALQTGAGSIANVTQQIDTQAIQEIVKALTLLKKELPSIEELPQNNKSDIIELVDDGIAELKKDKPNFSKIKSFISTIGEAISVTADLKPAYETLKSVATIIGLTLP